MKKRYALALLPLAAFSLLDWQPFAIDQHVAVQLPAPPTELDVAKLAPTLAAEHTRLWTLRAPEGAYLVTRLPGAGAIGKLDTAKRNAYYAGMISSILRNEKGQLLSRTPFPTAGGAGLELKYKGVHQLTGKRIIKYVRTLVLDSIGYSLIFIPTDRLDSLGLAGNEQRRRFFNSITVKP